jgi:RHS repeat-associated protein
MFQKRRSPMSGQSSVSSYQYNGLGDRLSQTVNGQTTAYALDLNAGLTQVLSDGTNTYTYGLGRISQTGNSTEYFLGDALGSLRQLTNTAGEVTYAKSYDPYGVVTQSSGAGGSAYGYTGEMQSNDMVYLRSRFYNTAEGRFLSRDTWGGEGKRPMTFNRWGYVNGNPINYFDPSGHILENESKEADQIVNELKKYSVNIRVDWGKDIYWYNDPIDSSKSRIRCDWISGRWSLNELKIVKGAVIHLDNAMGNNLAGSIGAVSIAKVDMTVCGPDGRGCTSGNAIELLDSGRPPTQNPPAGNLVAYYIKKPMSKVNFDQWTVVHELGHAWDHKNGSSLSRGLETYTGGYTISKPYGFAEYCAVNDPYNELPGCNKSGYFYGGIPPVTSGTGFNRYEDFAESVAAYVFPAEAHTAMEEQLTHYKDLYLAGDLTLTAYNNYYLHLYYGEFRSTPRGQYIANIISK